MDQAQLPVPDSIIVYSSSGQFASFGTQRSSSFCRLISFSLVASTKTFLVLTYEMGGNGLSEGSTRLDGLLQLLESGSNSSIRKMAASQIGDLVAAHPSETRPILCRVRRLLRSPVWEARVAAGEALAAIADQSPHFAAQQNSLSPTEQIPETANSYLAAQDGKNSSLKVEEKPVSIFDDSDAKMDISESLNHAAALNCGLRFDNFDIGRLMRDGAMLFGSSGEEYNERESDVAVQLARLKADLGLNKFSSVDVLDLRDEDLAAMPSKKSSADISADGVHHELPTADFVAEMSSSGISARERNRLKRIAKRKAKHGTEAANPRKRPRATDAPEDAEANCSAGEVFSLSALARTNDEDAEFETKFDSSYWDFQPTCEILKDYLLRTRWEWRHGAAVGLRHILMRRAESAGRYSKGDMGNEENARWLEDICCRLLCVLAMDRFADFVGDAVVAPVREAAAMTLGAVAKVMSPKLTMELVKRLLFLLESSQSKQWEVRHASLLGVRYILAVRKDMAKDLLDITFNSIANGLQDQDDDVRAAAAEAMLPVVSSVVEHLPASVPRLVSNLWEALLDLDDICASTCSIMKLLSELSACPVPSGFNSLWLEPSSSGADSDLDGTSENIVNDRTSVHSEIVELVPRLWPFFRHNSKAVRRAAVNVLHTIIKNFTEIEFAHWLLPITSDLFTRLYRNILFETEPETLSVSQQIWVFSLTVLEKHRQLSRELMQVFSSLIGVWIETASQETRAEAAAFDEAQNKPKMNAAAARKKAAAARRAAKARKAKASVSVIPPGSYGDSAVPAVEGPYDGALMQKNAAEALGLLALIWPSNDLSCESHIVAALDSPYGVARRVACDILQQWAEQSPFEAFTFSERVKVALDREILSEGNFPFAEVGASVGSFFSDSISLLDNMPISLDGIGLDVASLKSAAMEGKKATAARDPTLAAACAQSLKPKIHGLVTGDTWAYLSRSLQNVGLQKRVVDGISCLRLRLLSSLGYMGLRQETIQVSLGASATSAVVSASGTPLPQKVGPLIRSLTASIRTMTNPHLQLQAAAAIAKLAFRLISRQSQKPVNLMLKNILKYLTAPGGDDEKLIAKSLLSESSLKLEAELLAKRGSLLALKQFCNAFKATLFVALPYIWARIAQPLTNTDFSTVNTEVRDAMIILRAIVPYLDRDLHESTASLFPHVISVCAAPHGGYANDAPQCLADFVAAIKAQGMHAIVTTLIPLLEGAQLDKQSAIFIRRGAAKALQAVVEKMGTSVIPYSAFMIVPMMTRMVDEDEIVRNAAAGVFGTLIRLMPLEGGTPDDPSMSESMAAERKSARSFLGQLLGTEPRTHYQLPVTVGDGILLRRYQQECLDWLAFLNRYGLHGALCDDMGLGKTLMTLCMIAGDFVSQSKSGNALPSLVVCPSTIVAHWVMEAERFFGHALPSILQYAGPPRARAKIRNSGNLENFALVVTSYEILGNDLRHFEYFRWNYLVLDEGHVIKNSKTKVARAVRALSANHRLILTGTPIQNSVLELWAMFDFLMPGFLGSEKSFKEIYAKPIMASRDSKCSETDHEKGVLATDALHRQVLPFILRRLKDDVLSELPPKIMQDYYCNLTPLQMRLYEDFSTDVSESGSHALVNGEGDNKSDVGSGTHAFQALSYLRRLCSHPKLVLSPKHPEYISVQKALHEQGKSIDDISSSAKLVGLMNILQECGIGKQIIEGSNSGGHRVLIFAQLKQMLDLVESDLFKVHMPDVTYLRLDGSVEASKRQPIVTRFNADPTIDCLLLTTHVGGLGLNLTGADTVIFLEHDWNPTKDLQAMDRAHRLGQKRTVNVYRLITRGTLEEKIMNIQQFKTHIANAVVNRENSTLQTMNTEQLFDLFKVDTAETTEVVASDDLTLGHGTGMKAALAGLGELWEENQYADEYNMESFLAGMDGSTSNGKP